MDPNVILHHIRILASKRPADDLAEAIQALDNWLRQGGFPPADWVGAWLTANRHYGQPRTASTNDPTGEEPFHNGP